MNRTTPEIEARYVRSRIDEVATSCTRCRGSIGEAELVPAELTGANLTMMPLGLPPTTVSMAACCRYAVKSDAVIASSKRLHSGQRSGASISAISRGLSTSPATAKEQQEIAEYLSRTHVQYERPQGEDPRRIDRLKEYRTALISAAVTGKIDVREEVA